MNEHLEALLISPGSFVVFLGPTRPGAVPTMPGRDEPTAPPRAFADGDCVIEVMGPQTRGRRKQYGGATFDECLVAAVVELNAHLKPADGEEE